MSADAGHITQPSVEGPVVAMRAALNDAQIAATDVEYINAHGTGTVANDVTETRAIRQLFGEHAEKLAISSTKSMHGHALGAAGALEAFATLMALREGVLPPTASFTEADPDCDLDVIPNIARAEAGRVRALEFICVRRFERGAGVAAVGGEFEANSAARDFGRAMRLSPEAAVESLGDLRRVNRWFGGVRTTAYLLRRAMRGSGLRSASVLEVAAGDGYSITRAQNG